MYRHHIFGMPIYVMVIRSWLERTSIPSRAYTPLLLKLKMVVIVWSISDLECILYLKHQTHKRFALAILYLSAIMNIRPLVLLSILYTVILDVILLY